MMGSLTHIRGFSHRYLWDLEEVFSDGRDTADGETQGSRGDDARVGGELSRDLTQINVAHSLCMALLS